MSSDIKIAWQRRPHSTGAFTAVAFFLTLLGCSSTTPVLQEKPEVSPPTIETSVPARERASWEVFPLRSSLSELDRADTLYLEGRYADALTQYEQAPPSVEKLLRELSCLLHLRRGARALTKLSEYAAERSLRVDELPPELALLASFAYGIEGDIDQTISWFSVVNRSGRYAGASRAALRGVVQSLSAEELEGTLSRWQSDGFAYSILLEERKRRERGGGILAAPAWLRSALKEPEGIVTDQTVTIGALAPLSGKSARLGKEIVRGVSLAVGDGIQVIPLDESSGIQQSFAQLGPKAPVAIIGPLLAKSAEELATYPLQFPVISLSKKNIQGNPQLLNGGLAPAAQSDALVRTVLQRGATFVFCTVGGGELLAAFNQSASSLGAKIRTNLTPASPPEDLAGCEVVFFSAPLDSLLPLLSTLRAVVPSATFLGSANWNDLSALRLGRAMLEGAIFVTPFAEQSKRPDIQEFLKLYRERFNGEEPSDGLLAFHAYQIAKETVTTFLSGRDTAASLAGELARRGFHQPLSVFEVRGGELREEGVLTHESH